MTVHDPQIFASWQKEKRDVYTHIRWGGGHRYFKIHKYGIKISKYVLKIHKYIFKYVSIIHMYVNMYVLEICNTAPKICIY